ncbi:hypothetical protein E8E14_001392 [Neopestalotiopsis sp. 37M]|nr:hypothetical protein E8E14_001392 [Neopestalotiopsis sp. 37M]
MVSETFDFVVVGGGLAGLVVASRLSEDPETSVLVIEAGKDLRDDHRVKIPAFWGMLLDDPEAAWQLKTEPQEALGGREIKLSQGRMLGGSSALNGLSFSATSKANVEAWASLGNPGWSWDSFSGAMKKSYKNGPLHLAVPEEDNKWPQVWRETLSSLGFSASNDPFSGQVCGTLTVPDTINPSTKERSFSGSAYLDSSTQRPNLTIWTQTVVDKILFGEVGDHNPSLDRTVTGVKCTTVSGEKRTAKVHKEVILTAGALSSPRILELSGIGGKARLEELGIDVVIDNSFVGENLQNHPMVGVSYEVLGEEGFETADKIARQDPAAVAAAMEDYTARQRGPFSKGGANYAAHLPFPGIVDGTNKEKVEDILKIPVPANDPTKTTPAFAEAHKSFVSSILQSRTEASGCYLSAAAYFTFNSDGSMGSITEFPGDESYFTIVLLLAHPLSRGSVHIQSATNSTSPDHLALDPRYLTHPIDNEVLASHLQYAATIAATEPLAKHLKPNGKHNPGAPHVGSFKDIENVKKYVRETVVGAQHYTGTCSMMAREFGGVVDSQLRLYGSRNLRVCDASVIPITPRTNPQATVYGIAEFAADLIKAEHGIEK